MDYTDFSMSDLEMKFGISNQRKRLFTDVQPMFPSETLSVALSEVEELPVRSEKAKSEWIVVPILRELRNKNNKFFTIHSGENLNVDEARGLKGECDFILAKDIGTFDLNYPVIQIVEAKRNDLEIGVPQCAAQLLGAKLYNEKKGVKLEKLYGCVTTGNEWLFLCMQDNLLIDSKLYYLSELPDILGIFQNIINYYKIVLA